MKKRTVGIYLFDDVEVLDFAGPFEVFSVTEIDGEQPFEVVTLSEDGEAIRAKNGLRVIPDYSLESAPALDIVVIPGGTGATSNEMNKPEVLDFVRAKAKQVELMASVCTGAFVLAEAGLLKGKRATTHWRRLDDLRERYPEIEVIKQTKFVDQGEILTAAGISSGIELSLHIVGRLYGKEVSKDTAKYMEYGEGSGS
ncbi:DJ-1/PfpI family protein [Paenalkalicoccus suaedae]|uniref:DJ-1/PfpI family protein n=1 Tax=Paenalkalicoccus suaedae TaxID=2592382 RepID=A0A859FFL7_9BACI|nr:DJ-1/PfpI family protein [Paenalkalicoccus suaedae]QKS72153.1 DJ-1/PfpI family protein [Paenalkalicoccus suaedae]